MMEQSEWDVLLQRVDVDKIEACLGEKQHTSNWYLQTAKGQRHPHSAQRHGPPRPTSKPHSRVWAHTWREYFSST
jgi:hypothetical protein